MTIMSHWKPEMQKAQSPFRTIKTIRDIMFSNDIFTMEGAWFNHNRMSPFSSVGIVMPGINLITAGKGRNEQQK